MNVEVPGFMGFNDNSPVNIEQGEYINEPAEPIKEDHSNVEKNQEQIDEFIESNGIKYAENDEALESQDNNEMLNVLALEQVKLFLNSEKNFFTSSLIENVALLVLSKNSMKSSKLQQNVSDVVITFSQICKNIRKIEKQYGQILDHTILDDIIIESISRISDRIVADSIPYSSYLARKVFEEVREAPEFYAETHVDKELEKEYSKLVSRDIEVSDEFAHNIQTELDSKDKILNIVKSVQMVTQFISNGANRCKDITDYFVQFADVANNASAAISEVVHSDDSGITAQDVYNNSFYEVIVKTKDKHIQCGFPTFDSITNGGFEKDRIYLLSGKTGGGKSTILINIGHGMIKAGNGLFLPDVQILTKLSNNPGLIDAFRKYFKSNVDAIIEDDIQTDGEEIASKKRVILYITCENMEDETMKRYMSRIGLLPNVFWLLLDRDPVLSNHIKQHGFKFKMEDLPSNMDMNLKKRLVAITSYYDILLNEGRSFMKVIWREAYTIDAYDILSEVKKLERKNCIVDAVIVDYPDKLKPVESSMSRGDQTWDSLGKIIDNLKGLSKKVGAPVLAVSQFTRQGNKDSGNKNTVIKGGNTSGSQQKEYNSDMLINSNIHSKDDDELSEHHNLFKNSQRLINQNRLAIANNIFNNFESKNQSTQSAKNFTNQIKQTIDIMQLCQSIPDLQTMTNYIVKNRDGISDITFDCYILYGMYFVTDYDEEAIMTAQFAIDTHIMIVEYMYANHLIDSNALQMVKQLTNAFIGRLNNFREEIRSGQRLQNSVVNQVKQSQQQVPQFQPTF